jgi:hypothetical protein
LLPTLVVSIGILVLLSAGSVLVVNWIADRRIVREYTSRLIARGLSVEERRQLAPLHDIGLAAPAGAIGRRRTLHAPGPSQTAQVPRVYAEGTRRRAILIFELSSRKPFWPAFKL